jgi:hypothetical protein
MSRSLAAEVKRRTRELLVLERKLEKRQMLSELPKLKRKYEGRYFKYDNGYDHETRWYVYVLCKKVLPKDYCQFIIDSFQITPKDCRFSVGVEEHDFYLQTEITKEEYETALEDFLKAANRLTQSKIKSSRKKQ